MLPVGAENHIPIIQQGFAIVEQIVEAHGGKVAVHSSGDEGSKFILTLPASRMNDTP